MTMTMTRRNLSLSLSLSLSLLLTLITFFTITITLQTTYTCALTVERAHQHQHQHQLHSALSLEHLNTDHATTNAAAAAAVLVGAVDADADADADADSDASADADSLHTISQQVEQVEEATQQLEQQQEQQLEQKQDQEHQQHMDADMDINAETDADADTDIDGEAEGESESEGEADAEADSTTSVDDTGAAQHELELEHVADADADADASVDASADASASASGAQSIDFGLLESASQVDASAQVDVDADAVTEADADADAARTLVEEQAEAQAITQAQAHIDMDAEHGVLHHVHVHHHEHEQIQGQETIHAQVQAQAQVEAEAQAEMEAQQTNTTTTCNDVDLPDDFTANMPPTALTFIRSTPGLIRSICECYSLPEIQRDAALLVLASKYPTLQTILQDEVKNIVLEGNKDKDKDNANPTQTQTQTQTPTPITTATPTTPYTPTITATTATPTISTTTTSPNNPTGTTTTLPTAPYLGDSVPAEVLALCATNPLLGSELIDAASDPNNDSKWMKLLQKYPKLAEIFLKYANQATTAPTARTTSLPSWVPTLPSVININPTTAPTTAPTRVVPSDDDLYSRGRWTGRWVKNNTACTAAAQVIVHVQHHHHHHNHHHSRKSYGLIRSLPVYEQSKAPNMKSLKPVYDSLGRRIMHHHHHHNHHFKHIRAGGGRLRTRVVTNAQILKRAFKRQFARHARNERFYYDTQCNKHVFRHMHHHHHIHHPNASPLVASKVQPIAEAWINRLVPQPIRQGTVAGERPPVAISIPGLATIAPTSSPRPSVIINPVTGIKNIHHHHHHHHLVSVTVDGRRVRMNSCERRKVIRQLASQKNMLVYRHVHCYRIPPINSASRPRPTLGPYQLTPRFPTTNPATRTFPTLPKWARPTKTTRAPTTASPTFVPTNPPTTAAPTRAPYTGIISQPTGPARNGPDRALTIEEAARTKQGVERSGIVLPIQLTKLKQHAANQQQEGVIATPRGPVLGRSTGGSLDVAPRIVQRNVTVANGTNGECVRRDVTLTRAVVDGKPIEWTNTTLFTFPCGKKQTTWKDRIASPFKGLKNKWKKRQEKKKEEKKAKQDAKNAKKVYGSKSPRPSGLTSINNGTGYTQRSTKPLEYSNGQRVIYCNSTGHRILAWTSKVNETVPMFYDLEKNPIVYSAEGAPLRYVVGSDTPYFDSTGMPLVYDVQKKPIVIKNSAASSQPIYDRNGKALSVDAKANTIYYNGGDRNSITLSIAVVILTALVAYL